LSINGSEYVIDGGTIPTTSCDWLKYKIIFYMNEQIR